MPPDFDNTTPHYDNTVCCEILISLLGTYLYYNKYVNNYKSFDIKYTQCNDLYCNDYDPFAKTY